ncbi:lactate racemase domain-containing protein [Aquisphaera insulae]|uniref:lactate racemase domain-containing protein n=1 Tax=Aquisphaera insulae TaxID=2712864 RepID=UPI0013EA30BE|nr:lactate racemase domain-containing protein [Aquisphaera insulae]
MKGASASDGSGDGAAATVAACRIPWGPDDILDLAFPPGMIVRERDIVRPDLGDAVGDYQAALGAALATPDGMGRIRDVAGPGMKIAIVVDDPSRWTPVREALPTVLRELESAGVAPGDISISAGVGRHHAVDRAAMERRVGPEVAARYQCHSPPVDDLSAYDDLGTTATGLPVRVFSPVARAGLRILIGSVLPHLQAGFGGGYKLIFPGTSHRTTLGALHRRGITGREGHDAGRLLGGDAGSNPMRRAIHEAAGMLGPCVSISHLLGAPGQVFRVAAGHPARVQDALAAEARRRFRAPAARPADIVAAGNHPWPGDPMQSFKVLLHHRAASRPGGVLAGLFWTDPEEIDRSFPRAAMRLIAASGAAGGWGIRRAVPLAERVLSATGSPAAFMLRWARELVVDRAVLVYSPPLFERIGPRLGPVRIFDDQAKLWAAAIAAAARTGPRGVEPSARIFPQGGLTYVPVDEG